MVAGQCLDLSGAEDERALYLTHRLKTGALIRAAVLAGAYCASAKDEDMGQLESFSDAFGLLFQITDDILDVTGSASALGKTAGKDSRDQKQTFVTMYGLDGARQCADEQANIARASLVSFGKQASFLRALVAAVLCRSS